MNHLTYELEYLQNLFIEMLELVKSQFTKSIAALISHDSDLAEEIIRTELRVNAYELNIEKDCENIIALFQPVATELRYVLAILKSVSELERIGDHAEFFSKILIENPNTLDKELLDKFKVQEMFMLTIQMYDNVLVSFESKNSESARKVFKIDKELNKMYKKSVVDMKEELSNQHPKSGEILNVYAIISRLERTGDLLTNIGEEIIFYLDAEILKHKKKRNKMKSSENQEEV
jgi:phosphate transport system protein